MWTVLFALAALLLTLVSLREKVRQIRVRDTEPLPDLPSPLSRAITSLLGTAGGIYLTLNMACDFMSLEVPKRLAIWHMQLEPVAALSFILALLQPYILRLYRGTIKS